MHYALKTILPLLIFFTSCSGVERSEKGQDLPSTVKPVILTIKLTGAELEQLAQVDANNFIKPSALRFYLSDFAYSDASGKFKVIRDAYLYDRELMGDTIQLEIPDNAVSIRFGIGVPPGTNTGDPTVYSSKHPYSVKGSKGMHWGWSTGYRFIMFEGRRDSVSTGNFDEPYSFHTGTDSLYKVMTFALPGKFKDINLNIDGTKFFQGIDLRTENATHTVGNPDLARRFTANFAGAVSMDFTTE
ncbi:MAG: MbnP family protein [Bacteroidota bacterium]